MTLQFHVLGTPRPQGSKRHIGRGVMIESCKALKPWRDSVAWAAREAMQQQGWEKASGAQVAIVTIASLEGDPIEDVANSLYRSFGIGKKDTNEGALFLLAIQERRSRLEVGYGLEAILPDAAAGEILRAMRPALRSNQSTHVVRLGALFSRRAMNQQEVSTAKPQKALGFTLKLWLLPTLPNAEYAWTRRGWRLTGFRV